MFQIAKDGDLPALRAYVSQIPEESVTEVVNACEEDKNGMTALQYAARHWKYDVVVALVDEYGADVNETDVYGAAALHHAAK